METLEHRYARLCAEPIDIAAHLPALRSLAEGRRCVVELGVRYAASTTALLMGQPKELICVDIMACPSIENLMPLAGKTKLRFIQADSREIKIKPMDLLFIDTEHTYECCLAELMRHGPKCTEHIALHDTVLFPEINRAIKEFCEVHPFEMKSHDIRDNGFMVLERIK